MRRPPTGRTFGLISDLFVVAERRGGGIGRALMAEAEAHFRSLGMAQILIATMAANRPAYETYRELGYADYEIVMEKRLDRPD